MCIYICVNMRVYHSYIIYEGNVNSNNNDNNEIAIRVVSIIPAR